MSDAVQRLKVLTAGIFSLLLVLGVARFAYTPLLPIMQSQAGLGVAAGGWLAALNYAGYLAGAIAASLISDLALKDRLFRAGLVVAVASTAMMGMSDDLVVWAASRFIAGLSSAAGMLLGTGLILNWLIRHNHRSELGIHFAGVGLGIAGCSAAVAAMAGTLDWREQWFAFTAIGAVLMIPALAWLPKPVPGAMSATDRKWDDRPPSALFMRIFMAAYFCAGIGYVVSATFIVAIIDRLPGLSGKGWLVFLVIGLAAAPACIVWDLIARRTGDLNALILASALQVAGIVLPLALPGLTPALIGAVMFGGTFIGIVSLVLTMAGRYYPSRPAKMMGKMTVSYGVAQIAAPAVTGWLARASGSYVAGLYLAAAAMLIGIALLWSLKRLARTTAVEPAVAADAAER